MRLLVLASRSTNEASRNWISGMSSPSSQKIGSSESLPWSCQAMYGVMTKSPGRMIVRSPSTAV